ncbi:MAG: hypothetical protein J1E65_06710 [Lachnospiraceae bacterium]|nr:hypothetical protein [Lachnospiraceae bacterium]
MGIGGVSDYSNLFRNYQVPEIPAVDYRRLNKAEEMIPQAEQPKEISRDIDLTVEEKQTTRPVSTDVKEISLSFNRGEDYGYIGSDRDIAALDMQKAISDLQKDKVLQQYQYFVGESQNLQGAGEDGVVIVKF